MTQINLKLKVIHADLFQTDDGQLTANLVGVNLEDLEESIKEYKEELVAEQTRSQTTVK